MFEGIISQIEAHERYGRAVSEASVAQSPLILNYHTHGGLTGYCVSICRRKPGGLPVLGQPEELEELAHIRGVGKTAEEGIPLMSVFARELQAHYKLETPPRIQLNGHPAG
ncbi:MAG TPA: hypothetical protein VI643_04680 [Planctomycetota bacterium]|nr:hypothetical protein [Planctomycetota bacterium]